MAERYSASGSRPSDKECPNPPGKRCRTVRCLHLLHHPFLKRPWRLRRDDVESHELLTLGLREGQIVFEQKLHGFGTWAGLVAQLWMVETDRLLDSPASAYAWTYDEQYRLSGSGQRVQTVYGVVRAEARQYDGMYASANYREGPRLVRVTPFVDRPPRWEVDSVRPDDPELRCAYDMLETARQRGRPPGSKSPDLMFAGNFRRAHTAWWNAGFTRQPTKGQIAAEMGISVTTLRRRLDEDSDVSWPYPWPPPESME